MKRLPTIRLARFISFFFISVCVCTSVTAIYVRNKIQLETIEMEHIAIGRSSKINDVLTKLLYKAEILSALVVQNNGEIKDFESTASILVDDPAIKDVILAPDGVVQYVYPLEGNESLLGFYYLPETEGRRTAPVKKTDELLLCGPFHLTKDEQDLIGMLPIYINREGERVFWGFASVTLHYPQALDSAELGQLEAMGYVYEIWRNNPENGERQTIARSSYYNDKKNAKYIEYPIHILNQQWYFRISLIRMWYEFPGTWILFFTGIFVSFLIGFLTVDNYELAAMKEELEQLSYIDPLTGILNRRGGLRELEKVINETRTYFILCYMDLNKFKETNDSLGHHAGDDVLVRYSNIWLDYIDKNKHIFSRMGGDEFILVFKNTKDLFEARKLVEKVRQILSEDVFLINEKQVSISFSAGFAVYPKDAQTLDDLISLADHRMYAEKNGDV